MSDRVPQVGDRVLYSPNCGTTMLPAIVLNGASGPHQSCFVCPVSEEGTKGFIRCDFLEHMPEIGCVTRHFCIFDPEDTELRRKAALWDEHEAKAKFERDQLGTRGVKQTGRIPENFGLIGEAKEPVVNPVLALEAELDYVAANSPASPTPIRYLRWCQDREHPRHPGIHNVVLAILELSDALSTLSNPTLSEGTLEFLRRSAAVAGSPTQRNLALSILELAGVKP